MSPEVAFIRRSIAAFQGGGPLPPDIARRWESGLRAILTDPATRLDDALGIRPGRGQQSIAEQYKLQLRDEWVRNCYTVHHENKKKYPASMDIADNLDLLRANRDDRLIDDYYRDLFDKLSKAGIDLPSQRAVYDLLRNS